MAKPAEQTVTDDVASLPTLSRVARKRNQRIQQILEAAADVMGQHGAARFNLEDVAERMDLTKATLYHYFSSREVLLVAAIETLAERIIAELRSVVETDTHGATSCLQALLRKQLSVVVSDYPAAIEIFTIREPADVAGRVKTLRKSHDDLFRSVVRRGVESGEFAVPSESSSLQCMYAAMNMAPLWMRRDGRHAARQIEEMVETLMMLVGIVPRQP